MSRRTRSVRFASLVSLVLGGIAGAGCGGTDHLNPDAGPFVPPLTFHRLTVHVDGHGVVTSSPAGSAAIDCGQPGIGGVPQPACSLTLAPSQSVTLTAHPAHGATFTGWGGACTGTDPCVVTGAEDAMLTAGFTGGCEDECVAGERRCAALVSDQICGNFDDDICLEWGPIQRCADGDECRVDRCGDFHQLSVAPLPLEGNAGTVTSSPAGIECGDNGTACNVQFAAGQQITLTASSDDLATFDGWAQLPLVNQPEVAHCIGSTAPCTVTMDAPISLLAAYCTSECPMGGVRCSGDTNIVETCGQFDDDRCTEFGPPVQCTGDQLCTPIGCAAGGIVTATAAGDGQVAIDGVACAQPTCTQGVVTGTTATITAIPAPSAVFTGWSGACSGTGPCTAAAGETVTATFGDRCGDTVIDTLGGDIVVDPIAINASDVYWGDQVGLTVRRMSRAGGAPTTIATSTHPFMLVADDTAVYWLGFDGEDGLAEIRRFSNGAGAVLVPSTHDPLGPIALSATHVYYSNGSSLYRVLKAGGTPELIATDLPITNFGAPRIATDATHVYWIDFFGGVVKVPLEGGTMVQVSPRIPFSDTPLTQTYGIALDADHVYFSRMDFPKIVRVSKNGGPLETVVRGVGAFRMQITGDTLMWAGFGLPSATRIGSGVVEQLSKQASGDIAFDATEIYYSNVDANFAHAFIHRLARTPTCPF